MNLDAVILALKEIKSTGAWKAVSQDSGVSYDTVARIARGFIPNPGARTVEAIAASLLKLGHTKTPEAA